MAGDSRAKADDGSLPPPTTFREAGVRLLQPVPLTILFILFTVTALIGLAAAGFDRGNVLSRMATHEFARGLITYLFAVTTIGTSVVLVLAALMKEINEEAYGRGKEILALLLGVFGTIVGFYFGSEAGAGPVDTLAVTPPLVSASTVAPGDSVTVTASVSGGSPPYVFDIGTGSSFDPAPARPVGANGWVVTDVVVPADTSESEVVITLVVQDADGRTVSTRSTVTVDDGGG